MCNVRECRRRSGMRVPDNRDAASLSAGRRCPAGVDDCGIGGSMNGICLRFYVNESRRHHGVAVYEWLLETARSLGVEGGSAFRAVAGFGRHRHLHEEHFFELGSVLPVEVVFMLNEVHAQALLDRIEEEHLQLFHVRMPATFGLTCAESIGNRIY